MKQFFWAVCLLLLSCKSVSPPTEKAVIDTTKDAFSNDFTLAFGSCNKASLPNLLWDDILKDKPDVWIWGGDIVYADTDDPRRLKSFYDRQLNVEGYQKLVKETDILGTWDDHDYGLNDGGAFFSFKDESQKFFLDFLQLPQDDPRRERKGIYHSVEYNPEGGKIKIIILDTRYFRTDLTEDTETSKRYKPNTYGDGTLLGTEQWEWLQQQLNDSDADFNVVVSSIQMLSDKHGYETWGNFPHEVAKFKALVKNSGAKGVIVLSGDRHISDFSKVRIDGVPYPLIDFTSSGLTHSATNNKGEENPYRVGTLVNSLSYGLLRFNVKDKEVLMEMKGDNGNVQQSLKQSY
ncbi:alkaline phosphatase D family protein [Flavobacteriaceae bacterium M23B6Z8]